MREAHDRAKIGVRGAFIIHVLKTGILNPHLLHEAEFEPRVPRAIGLIRTGDTTPYANVILTSA